MIDCIDLGSEKKINHGSGLLDRTEYRFDEFRLIEFVCSISENVCIMSSNEAFGPGMLCDRTMRGIKARIRDKAIYDYVEEFYWGLGWVWCVIWVGDWFEGFSFILDKRINCKLDAIIIIKF